jgi:site-specific recombinase XerD
MICRKCNKEIPEDAVFCHICGTRQVAAERKHRKRPNGSGTIAKLSGGRAKPWMARKAGVLIGTYATRYDAQKALDALSDANINNRYNLTFADIYELWLPEHSRDIGSTAVGNYRSSYNHCESLHGERFRSLRASHFQAVIMAMEEKGLSKSTCEKVLQLFGQLSAWAIREGIMTVDYSRHITIAAKQKTEGKVFTSNELRSIAASTNTAAAIVRILLATGCRGNELFSAKLADCHDGYFVGGSKTASGRGRIIAVTEYGTADYRKLVEAATSAGSDLLIGGYEGNHTYANFAKREFKQLMEELALEGYTPYDCRHTFTTLATKSGMDKQILRRVLGHADLATTDKYYTHLDPTDILNATAALTF